MCVRSCHRVGESSIQILVGVGRVGQSFHKRCESVHLISCEQAATPQYSRKRDIELRDVSPVGSPVKRRRLQKSAKALRHHRALHWMVSKVADGYKVAGWFPQIPHQAVTMAAWMTTRARNGAVSGEVHRVVKKAAAIPHRRRLRIETDADLRHLRLGCGVYHAHGLIKAIEDVKLLARFVQ